MAGSISLTGTQYVENFDNLTTIPNGWEIYTVATSTSLGTVSTTYTGTATNAWNSTAGGFKNFAAGDTLTSTATSTQQNTAIDRALGIRQTSSFGDPGGSFVLTLANTTGLQISGLSFKAQMLDVQPRSTTWTVDYRVGSSGTFTSLGTYSDPGVFGSTTLTTGSSLSTFTSIINNQSNPVQIRISALSASTGSGNRDSFAIDDFQLNYSAVTSPTTPTVNLSVSSNTGSEAGQTAITVTATASSAVSGDQTVDLGVSGTGITSGDYSLSNSKITILSGQTTGSITFTIADDTLAEGNETAVLTISNPTSGITLGTDTQNITIIDNELFISEVHPAGSGNGTYAADWFELTNNSSNTIDITGWKMDDDSNSFASSVALNGVNSIAPGQSVVFIEGDATKVSAFNTAWFGSSNAPTGFVIGTYSGSGVGLSGTSDQVNIFDASGNKITGVSFGAATNGFTFDNKNAGTTVSALSAAGVNGGFVSFNGGETGSPGTTVNASTQPDLTVNVTAPSSLTVNTAFNYTLTAQNTGTANATGVVLQFTLPANVTYNSSFVTVIGAAFGTPIVNGSVLTFTGASINAGGSAQITVRVTPTQVGTLGAATLVIDPTNTITESNESNNSITTGTFTVNGSNTAPTIAVNTTTTTNFLDGGVSVAPTSGAFQISGVINDSTDPARTIGIDFNVNDAETPNSLTVSAISSNTAVVTNANLAITGTDTSRNLKITPTGVGYSDITVNVSDGSLTSSYVIKYAASAAGSTTTRFLTGAANASTAVVIDSNYMLVGDDENQALRLYNRTNSGLPVNSFDFTSSLGLTQFSGGIPREVDIESAAKVGDRIFWLGSQSNNDSGTTRSNRNKVFATDISGTGAATTLSYVGRYDFLKEDIIAWDANNGHGKGANYYGLAVSSASGVGSKQSDGYNIEGLEFAPDNTTAYIAFRAPQEPTANRTKALIVPVSNFTSLLNAVGGGTQGTATFGAPIELDLGDRGIREIRKNASNQYVIIAGPAGDATGVAPADFRLYTWTGVATDAPVLRAADLTALNAGGSFESIVEVPNSLTSTTQLQLLVDNGTTVFYNDGLAGSDLTIPNYQKSRSETIALGSPAGIVKIHDIQGSGSSFNSLLGGTNTIEGIVTRVFAGSTKLNGFYVQEEDADADNNATTSEAIFVYDPLGLFTGNVGDKVKVTGTVGEFTTTSGSTTSSLTQLTSILNVTNLGASTLPTAINVQLPVTSITDLERYEGMLVNLSAGSGDLTVTENFQLGRYGQVVLAATGASNQPGTDARLDQYTQFNAPSVSGYAAYLADIAKRKIYLDDGSSTQNLDPTIFGRGGNPLSATNTLRSGDTVTSITGILDERFEGYRIQTSTGVNFTPTNARPVTPPTVGGTLKVASFNVLNYFNGDGTGSTPGFNTSEQRGADSLTEFNRQRDKIIQAIVTSGADVIGLMEIENDGYGSASAIQDLVNGLNAFAGVGTYSFINPGTSLGTDAIAVGLIYKSSQVTPVGAAATITNGYGTGAFDVVGRKPLAQTFQQNSSGEQFTAVVNHFKSKGSSSGGVGDADAGDGQGLSNGTRTRQAQDLAAWLATKPTGTNDADYLLLGDFNAYAQETPITTLASAGYGNLLPNTSYSYVFDGQVGALDHALGSSSLAAQVTGADKWHINADEPTVLDYNTEFKTANQITSLYSADQFRSSDHDPVLVGLNLNSNEAPTGVTLSNTTTTLAENTSTATRVKVADIAVTDDGLGTNTLSLGGTDANFFEIVSNALYVKAGTVLDYEDRKSYNVSVNVDDSTVGSTPDATTAYTLTLTDVMEFTAASDTARGTAADDTIDAKDGNDVVYGYDGKDTIFSGVGADIAYGGNDNDTVYGDDGNDRLYGDAGNDSLYGGVGADILYGGLGNDYLDGGSGNDRYYGEGGDDTFVIGLGQGLDSIYGYETGFDKILVLGSISTFEQKSGSNMLIKSGTETLATLFNVAPGQIVYASPLR